MNDTAKSMMLYRVNRQAMYERASSLALAENILFGEEYDLERLAPDSLVSQSGFTPAVTLSNLQTDPDA